MLEITAHASGSTGNCYTVTDGKATIMLDCGLPFAEIKKLTGYKLPDAVLVTHEHKDHSKAAAEFLRRGVDVYMTKGTAEALGLSGHRLKTVTPGTCAFIGENIHVRLFNTQHDAADPCGFTIDDGADRVLYATDTCYIPPNIGCFTKLMIECNYSADLLRGSYEAGMIGKGQFDRLVNCHFSLEKALKFLGASDLSHVKEIWLIHLSRRHANAGLFRHDIEKLTGKPVYVAGKRGLIE